MTNNKEQHWKDWEKCCNWTEKDFVFELKESLKKNFEVYHKYFTTNMLTFTIMEMVKHGSYRNISVAIIERFVREFKNTPDLPSGIKLVDDIADAIRHTQDGQIMTTVLVKPPAPKGKRKILDQTVTPKLLVTNVPHLSWNEKNSDLWNAHVDWTVKGIWQTLFEEQDRTKKIDELRAVKWTEPIQLEIVDRFFDELEFKENIASHYPSDFTSLVKDNYGVTHNLTWHQQVIGYYATRSGLLDIGDTGVGKTAAALTAVALNDTMRNLIICPKALIANNQWRNFIRNMFKDAVIFEQKDALKKDFKFPSGKRVFYLLSYQTASRSSGSTVLRKLQNIDYLILDEGQRVKIRDEDKVSRCRARIENMLTKIRKVRKINVLMLTATPIVNTVYEAKSLLQLITGEKFKDVSNFNSTYNLVKMHVKLKEFSIRYEKVYPVDISSKDICCSANLQLAPHRRLLNDIGFLGMDQIALVEAKMAKIIEEINRTPANEKIILFTKYVTGMIDVMSEELAKNNISHTFFTGTRKEGLDEGLGAEFFNGSRVLIASSAVAEGIDKIQDHCNNVWFVGHGWTSTERQQVIGRVYRTGQKKPVSIVNFVAKINDYDYDQRVKIDRIDTKQMYHDMIVNGEYPDDYIKGKKEKWSTIVDELIAGGKVSGQRVVDTGTIRVLKKRQRKLKK
jgi:superfamily II DNA or RNA helicase